MSFKVKTISVFERQAKRLIKKFPSLKKEIQTLILELKEEPEKGTFIGHNCYKIRLAIAPPLRGFGWLWYCLNFYHNFAAMRLVGLISAAQWEQNIDRNL